MVNINLVINDKKDKMSALFFKKFVFLGTILVSILVPILKVRKRFSFNTEYKCLRL